ncbi:hypothetical protein [Arthrobacter sp. KBS0703]|uniref:hypothetical protein n=1 Tax=Arthrobacter sp. KBS0703 TaxID=1955698 RepID=UPI002686450C
MNESQPAGPGAAAGHQVHPEAKPGPSNALPAGPSGAGAASGAGRRVPRRWAAAAGVVAAGTGLVASELIAGFVSPSLSTMTALGGAVIDAAPPGVKDWAVSLFGTADKLALLAGMALAIAAFAAVSGVVELRRRFAGAAIFAAFGIVGVVAVLTRAQVTVTAVVLPVLAAGIAVLVLRSLIGRLAAWHVAGPGKARQRACPRGAASSSCWAAPRRPSSSAGPLPPPGGEAPPASASSAGHCGCPSRCCRRQRFRPAPRSAWPGCNRS